MKKIVNIDALQCTLLVFVSMLIFPLFFSLSFFDPFEKALSDFEITDVGFAVLHDDKDIKPDTNIVLINTLNLKFPHYLKILDLLQEYEPKVIGITNDVDKYDLSDEQKNILNERLNKSNVVYGYYGDKEKRDPKLSAGYLDIFKNKDKEFFTAREFYPKLDVNNNEEYSFALSIINKYDKNKANTLLNRNNDKERIYFKGNLEKFYWVHAVDILKEPANFIDLKDKILILGDFTADKIPYKIDQGYFTPLNEENVGRTFTDMYLIVLQANIISMILDARYYHSLPTFLSVIIAFLLCYINMIIFSRINIKYKNWYEITSVLLFLIESIIILFLTVVLFHEYDFELNLTLAIFAIALSVFVYEGYHESVKPLTLKAIDHIFKR
jgi:CHASE2 domain-containing sensor protein